MRQLGKALTGSCYVGIIFGVGIPRFYRVLRVLCVFWDGFLWCKRGELMVLCGHLGGRFSGSKKMSPFENISVDFLSDPLVRQIQEDGGKEGLDWRRRRP